MLAHYITGKYSIICEQIKQFRSCTGQSRKDICDGDLYKELYFNGVIQNDCMVVTLTLNTDGIPVFKSSNYAFWPIYLFVNELPYKMRYIK